MSLNVSALCLSHAHTFVSPLCVCMSQVVRKINTYASVNANVFMCQLRICVCVCVWWLSWELSPQMGIQLFLNEFNYRDGTIHQNWAPSRAPNSSVAAEKQFGASRSSSACLLSRAPSQKASRIYVCEPGDDRSSALRGGGFSSAVEPRGWTAPQPSLISSFSTPFRLIWFSSLSL